MAAKQCPECGGELVSGGYRPLFVKCTECGKMFHIDDLAEE